MSWRLSHFTKCRIQVSQNRCQLPEIDVPDTPAVLARLKAYARRVLLKRFDQKAIYMKVVRPIEQILVTREIVS